MRKAYQVNSPVTFRENLEVVLEEKRIEIIKEWIDSGRIEDIQQLKNNTRN